MHWYQSLWQTTRNRPDLAACALGLPLCATVLVYTAPRLREQHESRDYAYCKSVLTTLDSSEQDKLRPVLRTNTCNRLCDQVISEYEQKYSAGHN